MADATLSAAEDVAQFIDDNGDATLGTDLFVNFMPSSPPSTAFATVNDQPGFDPQSIPEINEQPTVQVIVKGPVDDPQGARGLAQTILEGLRNTRFTSAAGTLYTRLYQQGTMGNLGDDENRRPQFSLNFRMFRAYN